LFHHRDEDLTAIAPLAYCPSGRC